MAPLDDKLTPAPLLPTNSNGTSPTIAQYQPLLDRTFALLKPLWTLLSVVVLGTIYVFARYTEAQLIIKFFGWVGNKDAEVGVRCLYGVAAFVGSLIAAGNYVDGVGKSLLDGGFDRYYWHVWTALVMLFPLVLTLVFLGCSWVVIAIWQTLIWMVGSVGLGGSADGGVTATTRMKRMPMKA